MQCVLIRGSNFPAEIELSGREGLSAKSGSENYRIAFRAEGIDVERSIYAFDPMNDSLARYLNELSSSIGQECEKSWESLEGEFQLDCTLDRLGHVDVEATLNSSPYGPSWTVILRFQMDAGQVQRAASEVQRFFE